MGIALSSIVKSKYPETVKLAVAARSLVIPSQTFVRDDVTKIASDRTFAITWNRDSPKETGKVLPQEKILEIAPPNGSDIFKWLYSLTRNDRNRVAAFLHNCGAAVVLAEFGPAGIHIEKLLRHTDCRIVVYFRGFDASRLLNKPRIAQAYADMFPRVHAVVAPSQYLLDKLIPLGCPPERAFVVPSGVNESEMPHSSRIPGRILTVGRMVEKKSPLVVLEAFSKILDKAPQAHLDMVGDGPLLIEVQRYLKDRCLENRITLHGHQAHERVKEMMGQASILIQHSVTGSSGDAEGMPRVILEGMATGLTIISTNHSGIPEVIRHGVDGLLTEEGDVEALSKAILEVLTNKLKAEQMARSATKKFRNQYTQSHTTKKLARILFD